jgi:ubiquitin carboxyl-terminal hydrolase 5/13
MKRQYASAVPLQKCFERFGAPGVIDDFRCPTCKSAQTATTTRSLASFPRMLITQLRRFTMDEGWVPLKLSVRVSEVDNVNGHPVVFDLGPLQTKPHDASEKLLHDDKSVAAPAGPVIDGNIVAQLEAMGFPRLACERACYETKNAGAEEASNWLFGHMEDPLLTQPIVAAPSAKTTGAPVVDASLLEQITCMGIDDKVARHALGECANNVERAIDWVFSHPDFVPPSTTAAAAAPGPHHQHQHNNNHVEADGKPKMYQLFGFIVHKGNTIQSGHYVAYLWNAERAHWILFDDERVFISEKPPIDQVERGVLFFLVFLSYETQIFLYRHTCFYLDAYRHTRNNY